MLYAACAKMSKKSTHSVSQGFAGTDVGLLKDEVGLRICQLHFTGHS
jgi:hypothetical protein